MRIVYDHTISGGDKWHATAFADDKPMGYIRFFGKREWDAYPASNRMVSCRSFEDAELVLIYAYRMAAAEAGMELIEMQMAGAASDEQD